VDFLAAASILPESMEQQIAAHPQVASVSHLVVRPMAFQHDGKKVETLLVGYDPADGAVGGPDRITDGRGDPGEDEVVIDSLLARMHGLGIGDTLTSGPHTLKVIGISTGGNMGFAQAVFVRFDVARDVLDMNGLVTFFTFKLRDGTSFADAQAAIQSDTPNVSVLTSHEFAQATRHRILDQLLPIVQLIVGLAFIVGIAITSLTIYTATIERAREFGVMKAIGFNNMDLYRLVLLQSLITAAIGFVFGVLLALLITRFADRIVAQFILSIRLTDLGIVLIITMVMAAGAAVVPARRIGSVDPAIAFKG
jgi:putative ABC transport system permease protein